FLSQIGAQVGVGKQGLIDRIDRLEALLRYDRPDEKITRATRQSERERLARTPSEEAWLSTHREELMTVITGFVQQADRFEIDDREWVVEIAIDWRADDIPSSTLRFLWLAHTSQCPS